MSGLGTVRGYKRGHAVVWDEAADGWRFADTGEPFDHDRPCRQCGLTPHEDGRDGCFAAPIPGASGACCGHGAHLGYVNWDMGTTPAIPAPHGWWRGAWVGPTELDRLERLGATR